MNIAKILKYCPKGTKLYSLVDGTVTLESIDNTQQYPIEVITSTGNTSYFTKDGKIFANRPDGECVLFPSKDQRDWEEFRLPVKRGDIMMSDGKPIEVLDCDGTWSVNRDLYFDKSIKCYRIKPESKYRPFANAEECWAEMQKHQPFGWVKQINDNESEVFIHCEAITKVDGVLTSIDEVPSSYNNMYNTYKFADGTPFGVKEQMII